VAIGSPASEFNGAWLSVSSVFNTNPAIVARGVASQSADLQQWQNSAGSILASIRNDGYVTSAGFNGPIHGGGYFVNGTAVSAKSYAAGNLVVAIRGAAGQTGNLTEWQTDTGTANSWVNSYGGAKFPDLRVNTDSTLAQLGVVVGNATTVGAVIRGAASQTAFLQAWQNSAGSNLAYVSSAGVARFEQVQITNGYANLAYANAGGNLTLVRSTAAHSNPGANVARLYFRDGTNAGTLKLVVRAGAAGAETSIIDNIDQTGTDTSTLGVKYIDGGTA
jgi:hypothetical protein